MEYQRAAFPSARIPSSPRSAKLSSTGKIDVWPTPERLANHQVIVGPRSIGLESCTFQRNGRTTTVRVEGRLTTSVNQGAIAAAVSSLGIATVALWNCRAELDASTASLFSSPAKVELKGLKLAPRDAECAKPVELEVPPQGQLFG